eukprot:Seg1433.5 transcript_id=Seg1433.5/GoldUCD/mRNA.D3Y31 product="hypothetical protein" protein_id=Seg1433.5/GoldUCD/D3Y31
MPCFVATFIMIHDLKFLEVSREPGLNQVNHYSAEFLIYSFIIAQIASSCTRRRPFTVMTNKKNVRAFLLACFGAITVALAHERKTLPGGLICVRRDDIGLGDSKHIWFEIEEEKYFCYTGDGKSNCLQVSLLPIEKKSCLDCCKRKKEKEKANKKQKDRSSDQQEYRKKTDRLHKSNIHPTGIAFGCICAVIVVWSVVGVAVYRQGREGRHAQNQNQPEQVVPVQPMELKKLEVKLVQTTEDEELLQGQSCVYAGLKESIV